MRDYHQNMHDYNENMRRYLHLIENTYNNNNINPTGRPYTNYTNYTTNIPNTNRNDPTLPIINTFIRNYLRNRDDNTLLQNNYEDVVVRPSSSQIENATDVILFNESDENHNTSCPITLEPFRTGEEVCSIRRCSHLFKKVALMDWFRRNVRCPVCRYDIREYTPPNTEEDPNEFDELIQELVDDAQPPISRRTIPNSFTSTLTNAIRSFVNHEINNLPNHLNSAAELLYTFDIPISLDPSGNYLI